MTLNPLDNPLQQDAQHPQAQQPNPVGDAEPSQHLAEQYGNAQHANQMGRHGEQPSQQLDQQTSYPLASRVKPLRIGVVAGEVSGDVLGGKLMADINRLHPKVQWCGVGGSHMQREGLQSALDMSRLSVMGLVEVVKHLPDLLRAKEQIVNVFEYHDIDIFIGIDAPDFNLRLAKTLKAKGVFCVQYVSPSVWAWREKRIHSIMSATHLVLCLFPFELEVYKKYGHPARCVGHPALDTIKRPKDMLATRRDLVWQHGALKRSFLKREVSSVVGLLPGSRAGEIARLAPTMFEAVAVMLGKDANLHFLLPAADAKCANQLKALLKKHNLNVQQAVNVLQGDAPDFGHQVMAACDALVATSGTVTLEAMLLARPMVVVYKLNAMSYFFAKRMVSLTHYALPNILAGKPIVPELIQQEATAQNIAQHTFDLLDEQNAMQQVQQLRATDKKLRLLSAESVGGAVLSDYYLSKNGV